MCRDAAANVPGVAIDGPQNATPSPALSGSLGITILTASGEQKYRRHFRSIRPEKRTESSIPLDLYGPDYEAPVWRADPDRVRAKLHKILAEAKAAERLPWNADRAGLYRTIFPQMTLALPEEEAAQLRFEFETQMARLEAA